jgi:hypothetical protein
LPGALENARHEKFARLTAEGLGRKEAYFGAGYSQDANPKGAANRGSALYRRVEIKARVTELQEALRAQSLEATGLSRQWVLDELKNNAALAIAGDKKDLAARNKTLELIGKEQGMFKDQLQIGSLDAELEGKSTHELREMVRSAAQVVGVRMVDQTDDEKREWIEANAGSLGLRIERIVEAAEGAGAEQAVDLPAVSEAAGIPRSKLN